MTRPSNLIQSGSVPSQAQEQFTVAAAKRKEVSKNCVLQVNQVVSSISAALTDLNGFICQLRTQAQENARRMRTAQTTVKANIAFAIRTARERLNGEHSIRNHCLDHGQKNKPDEQRNGRPRRGCTSAYH